MSKKRKTFVAVLLMGVFVLAIHSGTARLLTAETPSTASATSISWAHLSSGSGDLPLPTDSTQQTSTLILDIDKDGLNDFVIAARRSPGPSLVWYRRLADGWDRYVIDNSILRIEAGGTFTDIDGDGDLDIVMGGDGGVNTVWWWENPYPNFNPTTTWTRRLIKNSGANKHHDQMFGDFDNDGRDELVYWNQGAKTLFLAEIPANPRTSGTWPATAIYSWTTEGEHEGLAKEDIDGDGLIDIVGGGRWFKFNGGTSFSPQIIDSAQTFSRAAAGQLKEGGRSEAVFVIGDGVGPVNWYEWNGSEWIGHTLIDQDIDHGHSLQVADMDGDGHQDIFLAEMRLDSGNPDAKIWIFYGDGAGNFTTTVVATGIGSHEAKVGDLDGDGDHDILGKPYNWDTPRVDVWLSDLVCEPNLDSWERHEIDSNKPWRALFIESADIDGDTYEDVITGGWWYKNPGSAEGSWARNTIGSPLNNMAAVYDFDRDGDFDILGTEGEGSENNPNFVWAQNDGAGNFTILDNIEAGTGDFLQGVASNSFGAATDEVALSWHRFSTGVEMLTVPSDPANQIWRWRGISPVTQDEDLSMGDIDRDGDRDLLLGTKWLRNDTSGDTSWADPTRQYRLPFSVLANGFVRSDKPAEIDVNFTSLLGSLGRSGAFDANSIRVVEVDASDQIIEDDVPFQFDPASEFDASSNALGTLIILIEGEILAADERHFQLYFDTADQGPFVPVPVSPRINTTDNVLDEGQQSFKIETAIGTYYYHKDGGGFSSLDDKDGNDWISHSTDAGCSGEFRGIPNLVHPNDGGYFHPGPGIIESSLLATGPLKTTILSKTPDNLWEVMWEIYPEYAQMSVDQADRNYWFLYEGTPGGSLEIDTDLVVRADGTETSAATSWTADISGEEWLYFSDPTAGRSLYLAHHEDDSSVDAYWPMNEEMTVFGFGRDGNARYLENSNHFTIGLTDQVTHSNVATRVNSAFQPLAVTLGSAQLSGIPAESGPWTAFTLSNNSGDPDRNQLADINKDGRLDAVVGYEAISRPGLLAWYEAPATPTNIWTEHPIATIIGPMSVDVADMDGDGDLDVVAGEHSTSDPTSAKLYVFENVDGQGQSWQEHVVYTGDEHHDGAQIVDIDNDGDLDIISIGWTHGRVVVYENKSCAGNLPPPSTATATSSAPSATPADTTSTPTDPTATPLDATTTPEAPSATPTVADPSDCTPDPNNVLVNPGFESGTASWLFYSNSQATFDVSDDAYQCEKAGHVSINTVGSNMQLYQKNFLLKAGTEYRFQFTARSSTGDDLRVYIHRHTKPYTLYGLNGELFNLSTSWQVFSTEFTTTGFTGTTTDTRLRFWFSGSATNGEIYWIDDVVLEEVDSSPSPTPEPTETPTPIPTASHTPVATASPTPVASDTPTPTASHTPTPVASLTATPTASNTPTPVASDTLVPTQTATTTPTETAIPATATHTAEPAPSATPTNTATATPEGPTSCTPDPDNVLANAGFEAGTVNWAFYTSGQGSFDISSDAYQCEKAAQVSFNKVDRNMQLFQTGFLLKANTRYHFSFAAYSSSGHDLKVYVHRHTRPYTPYGLNGELFNITQGWNTFSTEFTSEGFSGTTTDTRLRFWFSGEASDGDIYWIDNVVLKEVSSSPSPTPEATETPTTMPTASLTPATTETAESTATPTATHTTEPAPTETPSATPTSTTTPDDPDPCTPDPNNVLANPGFEEGTANWLFYSNSNAAFDISNDAYQCVKAGRVTINSVGSNMQLYQKEFLLRAGINYRFSFAARSSTGDDLRVYVHKHTRPYTLYGLNGELFNLSPEWQTFSTEFSSTGFSGTTMDTRLRFWFSGQASSGEIYWIDDVELEEIVDPVSDSAGNSIFNFDAFWESWRQFWTAIDP